MRKDYEARRKKFSPSTLGEQIYQVGMNTKRKKSFKPGQTWISDEGLTSLTCGLLMMFLALDAYRRVLMVSLQLVCAGDTAEREGESYKTHQVHPTQPTTACLTANVNDYRPLMQWVIMNLSLKLSTCSNTTSSHCTLTGHHDGSGVASKAVLQQPGQHRVPVWDVRAPPGRHPSTAGPRRGATDPTVTTVTACAVEALAAAENLRVLGLKGKQ